MSQATAGTAGKSVATNDAVREVLNGMSSEFESALMGTKIPTQQFIASAVNAIIRQPDLLDADRRSLYIACADAANAGLILDGKEAALVPFKGQVKFMPMVAGLIKLATESEQVSKIAAHVVYSNDVFDHVMGGDEHVSHSRPALGVDRGAPIGVYAVATLSDGNRQYVVMDKKEIAAVRAVARTHDVWDGAFWAQQWEKTAIRRLTKRLPKGSRRLDQAVAADESGFTFDAMPASEPETAPEQAAPVRETRAAAAVKARAASMPPAGDVAEGEFTAVEEPAKPKPKASAPVYDDDIPI